MLRVLSLPCPRPAGCRSGELRHTRTVAVGKEQASESREIPENAFTANPDYSVLLLVGCLRVKRICLFLGGRFPVWNVASSTCARCVCQHKQLVGSVVLGLISLFIDVGKWSLEALPLYWFHPSIRQTSHTGLNSGVVLPDSPLCVTEDHDGLEDVCGKLTGLMRSPLPPSAPPPPPPISTSSPTSTGGKKLHASTQIIDKYATV